MSEPLRIVLPSLVAILLGGLALYDRAERRGRPRWQRVVLRMVAPASSAYRESAAPAVVHLDRAPSLLRVIGAAIHVAGVVFLVQALLVGAGAAAMKVWGVAGPRDERGGTLLLGLFALLLAWPFAWMDLQIVRAGRLLLAPSASSALRGPELASFLAVWIHGLLLFCLVFAAFGVERESRGATTAMLALAALGPLPRVVCAVGVGLALDRHRDDLKRVAVAMNAE